MLADATHENFAKSTAEVPPVFDLHAVAFCNVYENRQSALLWKLGSIQIGATNYDENSVRSLPTIFVDFPASLLDQRRRLRSARVEKISEFFRTANSELRQSLFSSERALVFWILAK